MKVMGRWSVKTVDVRADGTGLSSRAGSALLALVADRVGLTGGLCGALEGTRERRSAHDPGRVVCDLAVMLADGGRCVSDLAALAGQSSLFGDVASVSTARRVVLSVAERELVGIRAARAAARARAWAAGAAADGVILDFDATPIDVHSEKEHAAGHYKGGFGFNPLLVSCGREVLAGILRPGNAGANNAEDHIKLLDLALGQLPQSALDGEILARSDSAGASHDLADACRECDIRFSFGYPIGEPVRQALLSLPQSAWRPAIDQHGEPRDGAWVTARLTRHARRVTLHLPADWPRGRRDPPRFQTPPRAPGARLTNPPDHRDNDRPQPAMRAAREHAQTTRAKAPRSPTPTHHAANEPSRQRSRSQPHHKAARGTATDESRLARARSRDRQPRWPAKLMIARTNTTPASMINYAPDDAGLVAQRLRTLLLRRFQSSHDTGPGPGGRDPQPRPCTSGVDNCHRQSERLVGRWTSDPTMLHSQFLGQSV